MIPKFALIKQNLSDQKVLDIPEEIRKELLKINLRQRVKPGMRIALTAGSRGIYKIPLILKTVIDELKALDAQPFVVPAMGSHGGATAEGQKELLQGLGITEESLGVPILATMDVVELGKTESGLPVYLDAYAAKADGIIVIGRVKPHTDFRAPIESGLHKMLAIGLGKHKQALAIHDYGVKGLRELMPQVAQVCLQKAPIMFGLALIENGYDQTAKIEAVLPENMGEREPELLKEAWTLMPKLPVDELDILIVREIGKEYSGTGMDTNIIGRMGIAGENVFETPKIRYIVALNLSEASHGNALGIGLADFTTEKLMHSINYSTMRENVVTSSFIERGKIPMAFPTEKMAIEAALRCSWVDDPLKLRMLVLPNTLHIDRFAVSEGLLPLVQSLPRVEVLKPSIPLPFDDKGNLALSFF